MVEKEEWKVVKGADLKDADGGPLRTRIVFESSNIRAIIDEEVPKAARRISETLLKYGSVGLPDMTSVEMGHNSKEEVEVIQSAVDLIWAIEAFLELPKYPSERWDRGYTRP